MTNIEAQKIDGFSLESFEMVIADSQIEDKVGRSRFFQETFLIADIKFEGIIKMFFLKFSTTNMSFEKKTLA